MGAFSPFVDGVNSDKFEIRSGPQCAHRKPRGWEWVDTDTPSHPLPLVLFPSLRLVLSFQSYSLVRKAPAHVFPPFSS